MSDAIQTPTPTAASGAAVPVSAPAAPTPAELRSGAIWNDPARRDAWLSKGAEAPAEPAPVIEPEAAAPTDAESEEEPVGVETEPAADASPRTFRRAGERGPKIEMLGEDGTPVAIDLATVKVRTKAGGEVVELAIPDLVRKAASEVGLNRQVATLTEQVTRAQAEHAAALEQHRAASQQEVASLRQIALQALTDDAFRASLAQEVQQYLSPEQRLARLQAERDAERTTFAHAQAQQQHQQAAAGFFEQVAPTLAGLEQQYPHVTAAELVGHFHTLSAPLTGPDGRIPPQQWPALQSILTEALPRAARERHEAIERLRTDGRQQEQATLAAERDRAQHAAQQATNTLARALRPAGGPGGVATAAPKPPIKTLKDAQAWAAQSYRPS